MFGATRGRTYGGGRLDSHRFALLLAKIAHGLAVATGVPRTSLVLPDVILRKDGAAPLPYFVGGTDPMPATDEREQELMLRRGVVNEATVHLVDIRLFGWLDAPTYRVVVSVDPPLIATFTAST
jgi:hypothetical protein